MIRPCHEAEFELIWTIINDGALAYNGVIPEDRWQEPYTLLIGTWADAAWAIRFYEKHGFQTISPVEKGRLLRKYWSIPERQAESSVVLAGPEWLQVNR